MNFSELHEHHLAIIVSKRFFEKHCRSCPWLVGYIQDEKTVKVLCEKGAECEYFSLVHAMIDLMYE